MSHRQMLRFLAKLRKSQLARMIEFQMQRRELGDGQIQDRYTIADDAGWCSGVGWLWKEWKLNPNVYWVLPTVLTTTHQN